jgi:hypothetical protein
VFATDGQIDYELSSAAGGEVTSDFVYDSLGRVSEMDHFADSNGDHVFDTGDTLLGSFHDDYFADGNKSQEIANDGNSHVTTTTWKYDGEGRLTSETFDGFDGLSNPLKYADGFTYDLLGNRIVTTHDDQTASGTGSAGPDSVTTSTYDANDRLLRESKDVEGAGNAADDRFTEYGYTGSDQTAKTVYQGLSDQGTVIEQTSFTYDVTGRMSGASVTKDGVTTTVSYKYDANGCRVERTQGSTTTVYLIDPANPTG